jgi:hypothetical protein
MAAPIVRPRLAARRRKQTCPYTLIVRSADGCPRIERFRDAGAYRDRLAALRPQESQGLSIDDLVNLLSDR